MSEFWKTKGFKTLSVVWNAKLQQSGFEDSEVELKGDRALRQRATNCYRQASELERDTRLEYYQCLGYLAQNTEFSRNLDRLIMLRHSEGASIKEIVMELEVRGVSICRETVRHIIRRWQMKWGVRTWSLQQRNLKK